MYETEFRENLSEYHRFLRVLEEKLEDQLSTAPEGTLHISKQKKRKVQYYQYKDGKEIYIPQSNQSLVKELAQKDYNKKILPIIKGRAEAIEDVLRVYEHPMTEIYEGYSDDKKEFLKPVIETDEQFIERFYREYPGGQNRIPFKSDIFTHRKENVRSKSEKIIADMLNKYNIPYVYEPVIHLKNGRKVYPDFVVLNVRLRKVYIIEHWGKMDDPEYFEYYMKKQAIYLENGFWTGENMLQTFECSGCPLDDRIFEKYIHRFLL